MAVAIFTTWTTYGTWMQGDERGWFKSGHGVQEADSFWKFETWLTMTEAAVTLNSVQRRIVEKTITDHCVIRNWQLHAVNCRSNHVHVVVTAPACTIGTPRVQFKAWCTRILKASVTPQRGNWWTERGWDVYVDDDDSLARVIEYTCNQ